MEGRAEGEIGQQEINNFAENIKIKGHYNHVKNI